MTALLLLTHEPADRVNRMIDGWEAKTRPAHIVVAYGGSENEFAAIKGKKVFVEDPRLRTNDHQREKQSYTRVLEGAVRLLADCEWDSLYLAEYDILPIVDDLFERLREHADSEKADLLGHRAWRIDDTLHAHYSNHIAEHRWLDWIAGISIRDDKNVVLSCLGCGQWWRREAVEAVIALGEPVAAYLELHLPTAAHHLGFRVRGITNQDPFVSTNPFRGHDEASLAAKGAWLAHPFKSLWK